MYAERVIVKSLRLCRQRRAQGAVDVSFVKHLFNKSSLEDIEASDVVQLVENRVEESLHLDYERIPKKHLEYDGLAQHTSGFLNTSGGVIVFGVAEKREKGRHIPDHITWSSLEKEGVENNLWQKIDPWNDNIRILPIKNIENDTQRIFLIYVPKSKTPPHMANGRYYMRLNFQTRQMGHNQVLSIFRQSYIQRKELISTVYGPLYNELATFYNTKWIHEWTLGYYHKILSAGRFLLSQDADLAFEFDRFYNRIAKWNKAVETSRFRLARIINDVANSFFGEKVYERRESSAIRLNIQAETTNVYSHIDQAILNNVDPIEFWKQENPFARVLDVKMELEVYDEERKRDFNILTIERKNFSDFLEKLTLEVQKDDLIPYIRKEFGEMRSFIAEYFFEELASRM